MLNRRTWMVCTAAAVRSAAQEWSQWRGANRDGAIAPTGATTWPDSLKQIWKLPVGEGHSSPVASAKTIVSFARRGEAEVIYAIHADSGKRLWEHSWRQSYEMNYAATAHGK